MANANVINLTDATFEQEIANSPVPVLVDFWAPWCGPCQRLGPIVDEIANERVGAAKIVKVDVDQNPVIASRFGIRSIPTMLLFKKGEVQEQIVGAVGKKDLLAKLDALN